MFGQCKSITKNTSNQHTNHIVSNIFVCINCEEGKRNSIDTVEVQEKEVSRLAQCLLPKGAFALGTRFDLDSIQYHRNPIRSTWILSALTKLLTPHDFVTSRPAYISRELPCLSCYIAMMFDLLLLTSLLQPSFT